MSPMERGSMPRPSDHARVAFQEVLPDDPAVSIRPMFGNVSAFVNGNMFAGLFGDDLFVRLEEKERAAVIAQGGAEFAPMPGRPMKDYVVLPGPWAEDPEAARNWIGRSLAWTRELPPKEPRRRK